MPVDIAGALQDDARCIAASNLNIAVEADALQSAFRQAGIPLLFVKGLTVGALAYPNPMLKMGWDIDLLIDPLQLQNAVGILAARGFVVMLPNNPDELEQWHRRSKESVWARADGIHVELHTHLVDNRRLVPGLSVRSPSQDVAITKTISLRTLADDELFAYLCVHGASSAWFRIKWITDVAGLLSRQRPAEVERLYRRSQELGAFRAAAQAMLLADILYGSLGGTKLRTELEREPVSRRLAAIVLKHLSEAEPREPTETPFGTMHIHLTQLGLVPGLTFAAAEARRQLSGYLAPRLARRAAAV